MTDKSRNQASNVDNLLADIRIIPVISIADASRAVELAGELAEAGMPVLEITLRTAQAIEAIARIAEQVPDVVVGAGTVLSERDLLNACEAGARFAIAPGCTGTLYRAAAERGQASALIPGVATASEIMRGLEHGYQRFKFFPAEAAGGAAMLRAWQGPFPQVRFIPTGGIGPESAKSYLDLPNVMAVGGSWMVPDWCYTSRS